MQLFIATFAFMSHATTQKLEYDQFTHLFAKYSVLVNFYLRHNLCSMPPPDEIVREHMFPKNVSTQAKLLAPPPVKLKREHMCSIYLHLVCPYCLNFRKKKDIKNGEKYITLDIYLIFGSLEKIKSHL